MGSDDGRSVDSRDRGDTIPESGTTTTPATSTNACEVGASWGARDDFAFEGSDGGGDFADVINGLIRQSEVSPIAVSSHMDPGCVWMVAFSAPDAASASLAQHATTFTPMLRHPAGLWTAAPQAAGWLRVIDRASHAVWIPIVDATGSATYGESSCASLSAVHVSAAIPASAGELSFVTAEGERTMRDLMGSEPSDRGWNVRFAFSADVSR